MKQRRQHAPKRRVAKPATAGTAGSRGAPGRRKASGAPTGAIVRPETARRQGRAGTGGDKARPSRTTARTSGRYGDVASLGEARAYHRLRHHARQERERTVKPPDPRHRDRRTIKTTKPLATRFGAGRPRFRLIATLVVMLLVIGLVLTKVGLLQGGRGQALRASASELWTRNRDLPAQRGAIFDRNGDELALSVPAATVAVDPRQIDDVPGTVGILAQLIGFDAERAAELEEQISTSDRGFLYVARQIDPAIAEQISDLGLIGVSTYPEDRRIMPGGQTGQSVIGDTDIDGIGIAGLELQYECAPTSDRPECVAPLAPLGGVDGEMTLEVAPGGRTIAGTEQVTQRAIAGADLLTTLDRSVQHATEQALIRQVGITGAIGGQVVVMDTDTGDIIAMATVVRRDGIPVVSSGNWGAVGAYEPGSVGKIITLAGALEDGAVTPDRYYYVPWQHDCTLNPNDGILHDSHFHEPQSLSVRDILVESSNVGTIYVSQEIGYERMHDYITLFGLGERTDLDFPGESPGILKPWPEWEGTERCTMAYGQGYAATPIQMTAAMNVIANDGTYIAPRLVTGTVGSDGEITPAPPAATHYVVSPETAAQMQVMLRDVVCDPRGTARDAQVPGISVGGKTGTAYKAQEDGTYFNEDGVTHDYYSSFVGFFPAEDPQVTVLISIDEPQTGFNSGGQSAAPLFREIAPIAVHELAVEAPPGSTDCSGA